MWGFCERVESSRPPPLSFLEAKVFAKERNDFSRLPSTWLQEKKSSTSPPSLRSNGIPIASRAEARDEGLS
ncbi:hypothetical protein AAHA92_00774 [Salvia divinorum]|uniref:Uncharacterized protein n=1 Tax=Salvia divinorum TaxID=28513 RepID=A0ABD1IKP3_SALDI